MVIRKVAALIGAAAVVVAACGGGATAEPSGPAAGGDCVVGVSWNNYQEERWAKWDEPALKAAIEAGGGSYISNDAASSEEKQASNVENLISQGAKVVVVLAQNGEAIKPAVAAAIGDGIPVIAYDRLIEDPKALYITFDNVEVGRMQAREILKAMPKGNYVFIKGNQADANADFLRGGQEEILKDAIAAGDIVNVGESYTDNWDPAVAQTNMEQILTANNNDVDAVVARTTERPAASSRRSAPRASPARSRSPARTATRRPSTGLPRASRPSRSGRTPAIWAPPPALPPSRSAAIRTSPRSPTPSSSRARAGTT